MKIKGFAAFALLSSALWAGASAPAPPPADTLREIDICRKTFDENYRAPYTDPLRLAQTPTSYPEWENVYFNRELYRKRLEDAVARDWSIGGWWWQAEVRAYPKDALVRGGPIDFVVHYPWFDARKDLVYTVSKGTDGKTVVRLESGTYYTPRHGYLGATFIMLLHLIAFGMAIAIAGRYLYLGARKAIDLFAEKLSPGRGKEPWVQRFAACVLGAAVLFVFNIVWALAR